MLADSTEGNAAPSKPAPGGRVPFPPPKEEDGKTSAEDLEKKMRRAAKAKILLQRMQEVKSLAGRLGGRIEGLRLCLQCVHVTVCVRGCECVAEREKAVLCQAVTPKGMTRPCAFFAETRDEKKGWGKCNTQRSGKAAS